jgi:pSer/pThr/pTyr-binding forkhead associated (FHA) protein
MKQPMPIVVQLVHIHGPMKGEIQEFDRDEIHIGRHPSCDLQFPKDLAVISRKHAVIVREGNRFKILDSSTNGTFVNGTRISETWLKNGDVIFFTQGGPKVSFLTREGTLVKESAANFSAMKSRQHNETESEKPKAQAVSTQSPPPHPAETHPAEPLPKASPRVESLRVPLVIQYGPLLKSFTELPIIIGTHADCDLVLDHASLSHRHAQIFFSQGGYMVKDLTGSGRIRINDRQISTPSPLNPGDRLFLTESGPAFQFMEGGRMAEIAISAQAPAPQETNTVPENPGTIQKKTGSLFNRLFNRT